MKEYNPKLQQAILESVTNQIESNQPPETKQTLKRLMDEGYEYDDCVRMIGSGVAYELFYIMKHHQEFNEERYIKHLANLPELPDDECR
jgi:hypothetical protein